MAERCGPRPLLHSIGRPSSERARIPPFASNQLLGRVPTLGSTQTTRVSHADPRKLPLREHLLRSRLDARACGYSRARRYLLVLRPAWRRLDVLPGRIAQGGDQGSRGASASRNADCRETAPPDCRTPFTQSGQAWLKPVIDPPKQVLLKTKDNFFKSQTKRMFR